MQSFFQRNRVFFLHFTFWLVYMSFLVYQISNRRGKDLPWDQISLHLLSQLFFTLLITYFNYFFLLPRFLKNKKFLRYLLEFIGPFALIVALRVIVSRYLIDGYTYQEHYFYSTVFIVQTASITLFIVIFVGMLRFAVEWFELEARRREIENEKLISELNFLKAQINPHFLFNTLNNLYYLVFTKSDNATEVISKLSQMMRYMIYETNHEKVAMSKEIEYMQNYIDLEKLRLSNQVPIQLTVEGDPSQATISPLIFITFLENAFKHGVSSSKPGAWVNVAIHVSKTECAYEVINSKIASAHPNANGKSGIGLQNVKRRLELSYPGKYDLKIDDLADQYKVSLKIDLT